VDLSGDIPTSYNEEVAGNVPQIVDLSEAAVRKRAEFVGSVRRAVRERRERRAEAAGVDVDDLPRGNVGAPVIVLFGEPTSGPSTRPLRQAEKKTAAVPYYGVRIDEPVQEIARPTLVLRPSATEFIPRSIAETAMAAKEIREAEEARSAKKTPKVDMGHVNVVRGVAHCETHGEAGLVTWCVNCKRIRVMRMVAEAKRKREGGNG